MIHKYLFPLLVSRELSLESVAESLCESMGALVREGHPLFIGEGGGGASATFMQEEGERRNRFCMREACGLVK